MRYTASMNENQPPRSSMARNVLLLLGCVVAGWLLLAADLQPGTPAVSKTAGVAVLMATLWITELVPLAITALLPVILFPLLGIQDGKTVSKEYFNHIIFLFIGGFMVALAMQRWNLHRRIAIRILMLFGGGPSQLLLGFMVATAALSMWISNTAATMMMVTIVAAVLATLEQRTSRRVAVAWLLGVAYAASIGGIATLVGTPPNMSLVRLTEISFPDSPSISFASWLAVAVPVSLVMFAATFGLLWLILLRGVDATSMHTQVLHDQYQQLGAIRWPEKVVLVDFVVLVVLWIFRADIGLGFALIPGWSRLLPESAFVNDGTVAIALALLLFFIPSRQRPGETILDWPTAVKLPWNIVLLFGGGFALAGGIVHSGLADWLGTQLQGLAGVGPLVLLAIICLSITFLTELTSNTATTEMILPIMAALAVAIEVHPLFLMVPVTLSCSCAFMMPVATPPNAIVFGTGQLAVRDMVRAGFLLNLFGVLVIVGMAFVLLPYVWELQIDQLPDWAQPGIESGVDSSVESGIE